MLAWRAEPVTLKGTMWSGAVKSAQSGFSHSWHGPGATVVALLTTRSRAASSVCSVRAAVSASIATIVATPMIDLNRLYNTLLTLRT
jgi:hypothetical protein